MDASPFAHAGRLYVVDWPYTDGQGTKSRPAIALTDPDHNGDAEFAMITSRAHHPDSLPILDGDYAEGRLPRESTVRLGRPLVVHTSRLVPLAVTVKPEFLTRVRKAVILRDTRTFSAVSHAANRPGNDPARTPFVQGKSGVPYAGRVFTEDEVEAAVGATLDFWLTLGAEGEAFEKELAQSLDVRHSLLVNSGSSANLVAFSALTSHKLPAERRIQPGDEVITVAAGFPTTVAPIVQAGAVPVFIDNDPITGNADVALLEAAFVPGKTKAVMMAHTLGNPFDLAAVLAFCAKHNLWLIEDNCDALGCTYSVPEDLGAALGLNPLQRERHLTPGTGLLTRWTGSWGDLSTQSFYPPHHLTMGEGGAVSIVRNPALKIYAESFRDWGRDCWCPSGKDNTCNKRFGWRLGELPEGYDHKYIYSHLGYNLKPLDPQAAIGRQQLKKLPAFIQARKDNWARLRAALAPLEHLFEFTLPTHARSWSPQGFVWGDGTVWDPARGEASPRPRSPHVDPSWFGFMLLVRPDAPFNVRDLARHLDEHKVGNRMLFGGNLVRQPVFVQLRRDRPDAIRIVGRDGPVSAAEAARRLAASAGPDRSTWAQSPLPGADRIMREALFLGTFPGMTPGMVDYMAEVVTAFANGRCS